MTRLACALDRACASDRRPVPFLPRAAGQARPIVVSASRVAAHPCSSHSLRVSSAPLRPAEQTWLHPLADALMATRQARNLTCSLQTAKIIPRPSVLQEALRSCVPCPLHNNLTLRRFFSRSANPSNCCWTASARPCCDRHSWRMFLAMCRAKHCHQFFTQNASKSAPTAQYDARAK